MEKVQENFYKFTLGQRVHLKVNGKNKTGSILRGRYNFQSNRKDYHVNVNGVTHVANEDDLKAVASQKNSKEAV